MHHVLEMIAEPLCFVGGSFAVRAHTRNADIVPSDIDVVVYARSGNMAATLQRLQHVGAGWQCTEISEYEFRLTFPAAHDDWLSVIDVRVQAAPRQNKRQRRQRRQKRRCSSMRRRSLPT